VRLFAWLYTAVFALIVCYTWILDIALRNDPREHLLGDILLACVTFPLSLTMEPVFSMAPHLFDGEFIEIAYLTVLGALEAAFLFWLAGRIDKVFNRAPNHRWSGRDH
jgi:hypothetical protein